MFTFDKVIPDERMRDDLKEVFLGASVLIMSWALVTAIHELFHAITAMALGYEIALIDIQFTFGSLTVQGLMSPVDTVIVAMAGTVGLTAIGVVFIYVLRSRILNMVGVIFLARAWIDSLPLYNFDGAYVAQNSGLILAWMVAIMMVIVSGGAVMHVIKDGN